MKPVQYDESFMSWRDHILRYGDTQIACFVCLSYAGPAKEDHKTVLHSVAQHSPSWNYAFKKTGSVFLFIIFRHQCRSELQPVSITRPAASAEPDVTRGRTFVTSPFPPPPNSDYARVLMSLYLFFLFIYYFFYAHIQLCWAIVGGHKASFQTYSR